MGPQHPATHGVLRLILRLDGEVVVHSDPQIGYLHRGIEKLAENKTYQQFTPYTDRLDYVASISNNFGYCLAVEKLLGLDVPLRADYLRVIMTELTRLSERRVHVVENKIDLLEPETRETVVGQAERLAREGSAVAVSAWTGEGIEALRETIAALIDDDPETQLTVEPHRGDLLAWLYANGRVTGRETDDDGRVHLTVRLHPAALGRLERLYPDVID